MKIIDLQEASSLIGMKINNGVSLSSKDLIVITTKTKDERWHGNFDCRSRGVTTLVGAPKFIDGYFTCADNSLSSLKGAPISIGKDFDCANNPNLTSLNIASSNPISVGADFVCSWNGGLKSLKDIHKQIKEMNGKFYAHECPIKSHILGLLYIQGCQGIILDDKEVENIINKFLPNHRGHKGVFECQCALQDADLDDYAHL